MIKPSRKLLLAALGAASLNSQAFAAGETVGVTAAVNPDATGQLPNEPLRELLVGHDLIRNERIKTASIGQAQLLFTDQSTLTVARNSEILIDEFVFDPVLKSSTKEWRYGVTGQLGLSDNIAANLHVVHEDTFANLPNTRIRNTQAVLGVLLSY